MSGQKSNMAPQETAWAQHELIKKGGQQQKQATGNRCWSCATVHARAFPGCSWEELLLKMKTSSQMQSVFLDAKAVLAGKLGQTFVPEALDDWQALDVIMEKCVLAYSIDEFKTEFGCLPGRKRRP